MTRTAWLLAGLLAAMPAAASQGQRHHGKSIDHPAGQRIGEVTAKIVGGRPADAGKRVDPRQAEAWRAVSCLRSLLWRPVFAKHRVASCVPLQLLPYQNG